jgi:hypothetical protein
MLSNLVAIVEIQSVRQVEGELERMIGKQVNFNLSERSREGYLQTASFLIQNSVRQVVLPTLQPQFPAT